MPSTARRRVRRRPGAPARAVALTTLAAALCGACRPGTVRLSFRPRPGSTYRYRIAVDAITTTALSGQPPRSDHEQADLVATQRVLSSAAGGGGVLEVRLDREGSPARTFVVRFDRGAQLAEVQRVEGLPAGLLGGLGLTEVFPSAASAPPARALAPASSWVLHAAVEGGGQLSGRGRLVGLGVRRGRRVATTASTYELPVLTEPTDGRTPALDGLQRTSSTTVRDIGDGAVEEDRATTRGGYDVRVPAPGGQLGPPLTGRVTVVVRSTTVRLP